jgi:hypothetical protein
MYRASDPLAFDPLGPMDNGPSTGADSSAGPLALDPLSPIDWGRIDADDSEHTSD